MRTLVVIFCLALAALAEPTPAPTPAELHLSIAAGPATLGERVNAAPAPTPAATPAPRESVAEPLRLQFQFFRFGPVLGTSFRL